MALSLHRRKEEAGRIWEKIKQGKLVDLPPKYLLERGTKEDKHYPAVLAAVLARSLGEDPTPYLERLRDFDPQEWDSIRLVLMGFYLNMLRRL